MNATTHGAADPGVVAFECDVGPRYSRGVRQTLDQLLLALAAPAPGVDVSALMDEIEIFVEEDPEGSRTAVYAYATDQG